MIDSFPYIKLNNKEDIEIPDLNVFIHQPTIAEVSEFGEDSFFYCLNLFFKSGFEKFKNSLCETIKNEDERTSAKNLLNSATLKVIYDYLKQESVYLENFLKLSFPTFSIVSRKENLFLVQETPMKIIILNDKTIDILKDYWREIYYLEKLIQEENSFVTMSDKAKKIADKINKSRQRISEEKGEGDGKTSVFGYYQSKLSVMSRTLSILDTNSLTVYQLLDQFHQCLLLMRHETSLSAALAGGGGEVIDFLNDNNTNN